MSASLAERALGAALRNFEQAQLEEAIERGEPRIFTGPKRTWSYWRPAKGDRIWFCWTPRPDTNGDFWTWDLVWTGSRGRPKRFVRCAKRRTARDKAWRRFQRYHRQGPGPPADHVAFAVEDPN